MGVREVARVGIPELTAAKVADVGDRAFLPNRTWWGENIEKGDWRRRPSPRDSFPETMGWSFGS